MEIQCSVFNSSLNLGVILQVIVSQELDQVLRV